ncbi:hypothetical protein LOTGIDRAFT_162403 [Lottia gigantea]|uniref:CUB domain-containing protein n=1 Tax=Lottia gigantea TaxID=225164 RepID=V4BU29_LOTGI|nr:hypothetical protein LOTGIDRAFT_162403 [Lottia gigantea]ESO92504.1 hypothetical protein LOTGIDRAFT_162403 [Lottia gigantea]
MQKSQTQFISFPFTNSTKSTHNGFLSTFTLDHSYFRIPYLIHNTSARECVNGTDIKLKTTNLTDNYIISPNFPEDAPRNVWCGFKLTAPVKRKVCIEVELAVIGARKRCKFNTLKIFDGANQKSILLVNLCRRASTDTYCSSKRSLYVQFSTDQDITLKDSFKIRYYLKKQKHTGEDKSNNALIFIIVGMVLLLVCVMATMLYIIRKNRVNYCVQKPEESNSQQSSLVEHDQPLMTSGERDDARETALVVTDPVDSDRVEPPTYNEVLEQDRLRSSIHIAQEIA